MGMFLSKKAKINSVETAYNGKVIVYRKKYANIYFDDANIHDIYYDFDFRQENVRVGHGNINPNGYLDIFYSYNYGADYEKGDLQNIYKINSKNGTIRTYTDDKLIIPTIDFSTGTISLKIPKWDYDDYKNKSDINTEDRYNIRLNSISVVNEDPKVVGGMFKHYFY